MECSNLLSVSRGIMGSIGNMGLSILSSLG